MGVSIRVELNLVSQDIHDNTSTVALKLHCSWDYGSYNHKSPSGTVKFDNVSIPFKANINPNNTTSGSNVIFSYTKKVKHNTDGTGWASANATFITGLNAGTITASKTLSLPQINRYAVMRSVPNFTDEENPTIKYLNAGKLPVQAGFKLTSGDIVRSVSTEGGEYTFILTDEERVRLRKHITTGSSKSITFFVRNAISTTSYNYSYAAGKLTLVNHTPIVSIEAEDTNAKTLALTGNKNSFIKYFSNAKITGSAAARKEATLKEVKVSCGNKAIYSASGAINAVESGSFTIAATDSRDIVESKTLNKGFVNYIKLTCNLDADAPKTDGTMEFDVRGNYFNSTFGAVANTLQVQYRIKENDANYSEWRTLEHSLDGNTYSVFATISGLNYLSTYTIQTRAVDKLMTVNSIEKVVNTVPVFDWSENEFNFNVNVSFPNKNIKEANIGIRSTNSEGTSISCLVPNTDDDSLMLGWGNYNAGIGRTNIYGKEINLATTDYAGNINANGKLMVNGREYAVNKVLWSGGYYMTSEHKITFSENVSEQPHGIVLVFSYYSGGAQNYYFQSFFIPKELIDLQSGYGHTFVLAGTNFNPIGTKYMYIGDTGISGNDNNKATGTTNGITYNNAAFVLRYVIGV